MTTEPRLIEALQQAFTSMPAGSQCESCPTPDRLWAAVRLELPAEERRQIVQHAAACAACAEDWRVSWKLWQEQQCQERGDERCGTVVRGPWWSRAKDALRQVPLRQVIAASLVVVAVGVVGYFSKDTSDSALRAVSETLEKASPARMEMLVEDGATLPRDNVLLHWTPGPDGSQYEVRLMTVQGDTLYRERDLHESSLRVPPDKLDAIPPGGEVYWQVQWIEADGLPRNKVSPRSIHIQ